MLNNYLESEALIYCISAQVAITSQGEALQKRIKLMANDLYSSGDLSFSYDRQIQKIVEKTKKDILDEGWDIADKQGVSWFIGLYAQAYSIADSTKDFKQIFQDAFKKYFQVY